MGIFYEGKRGQIILKYFLNLKLNSQGIKIFKK